MSETEKTRGICSACLRLFMVRNDGNTRHHRYQGQVCGGSGKPAVIPTYGDPA